MKYVRKAGSPFLYARWCTKVDGTSKADWREVPSHLKEQVLSSMVKEQGGICAYTMRRIDERLSHVEHIKPQALCRAQSRGSDLEYSNLIACFPREGMRNVYRYGAQKKGDWWAHNGAEFVSPLQPTCELAFRFHLDGSIAASGGRAAAARTTIGLLALDHQSLTEDRKRVIEEFVYGSSGKEPLSLAGARRVQRRICERDVHGRFHEFCVAVRCALDGHMAALDKLRRRVKARRRKRSRGD